MLPVLHFTSEPAGRELRQALETGLHRENTIGLREREGPHWARTDLDRS
jgi:hypothetical protein